MVETTEKHPTEKLLSKKEVMEWLGISMGKLDRLIKQNEIHYVKIGRQYRFSKQKLYESFEGNEK